MKKQIYLLTAIVLACSAVAHSADLFSSLDWWQGTPVGYYYGSRSPFFADVTGDGNADAIVVDDGGVTVHRSTGSAFGPAESWTQHAYYGSRGTFFVDVTGDGKADAIVVNDGGVTVRRSTGSAFSPNEAWTLHAYYGSRGTYFADVTGDGKADAIVVNDGGVTVRRSTGSAFSPNEAWTQHAYYGSRGTYFADVTGDGKADAIVVNWIGHDYAEVDVTVRRSNGFSFNPNETGTRFYYGYNTFFADVTGNGRADVIKSKINGLMVGRAL